MPAYSTLPTRLAYGWDRTCQAALGLATTFQRPLGLADHATQSAAWFLPDGTVLNTPASWSDDDWQRLSSRPDESHAMRLDTGEPVTAALLVNDSPERRLCAFYHPDQDAGSPNSAELVRLLIPTAEAEASRRLMRQLWRDAVDLRSKTLKLVHKLASAESAGDAVGLENMAHLILKAIHEHTLFTQGAIVMCGRADEPRVVVSHPPEVWGQLELLPELQQLIDDISSKPQGSRDWCSLSHAPASRNSGKTHLFVMSLAHVEGLPVGVLLLPTEERFPLGPIRDDDVRKAVVLAEIGSGVIAAARFHASARQKAEMIRAKDRLLSYVSHELRTPLYSIRDGVEKLRDPIYGELQGDHVDISRRIFYSVQEAVSTTETMLAAARANAGTLPFKPSCIEALPIIESEIVLLESTIKNRDVTLQISNEINTSDLWADERHFRLMVRNLLGNAVKYCSENGKVLVSLIRTPKGCDLEIRNDGEHVRSDDICQIWFPFIGNETALNPSGSGIGLALVKDLADRHYGNVAVRNVPGGCVFSVSFPIRNRNEQ